MAVRTASLVLVLAAGAFAQLHEVSRECKAVCNDLISELPQGLDCRQYRMMLPRPKVGKACTSAYDDGAFAACTSLCDGEDLPKKDGLMGNFCRKYLSDYPKPTIHKSCRTGYATGFDKSAKMAREVNFEGVSPYTRGNEEPDAPPVTIETKRETPAAPKAEPEKAAAPEPPAAPKLLVNMPVTVDDTEIFLQIFEGDDATKKVSDFCAEYMSDSADSCVRQLTPHVEKKLAA